MQCLSNLRMLESIFSPVPFFHTLTQDLPIAISADFIFPSVFLILLITLFHLFNTRSMALFAVLLFMFLDKFEEFEVDGLLDGVVLVLVFVSTFSLSKLARLLSAFFFALALLLIAFVLLSTEVVALSAPVDRLFIPADDCSLLESPKIFLVRFSNPLATCDSFVTIFVRKPSIGENTLFNPLPKVSCISPKLFFSC